MSGVIWTVEESRRDITERAVYRGHQIQLRYQRDERDYLVSWICEHTRGAAGSRDAAVVAVLGAVDAAPCHVWTLSVPLEMALKMGLKCGAVALNVVSLDAGGARKAARVPLGELIGKEAAHFVLYRLLDRPQSGVTLTQGEAV